MAADSLSAVLTALKQFEVRWTLPACVGAGVLGMATDDSVAGMLVGFGGTAIAARWVTGWLDGRKEQKKLAAERAATNRQIDAAKEQAMASAAEEFDLLPPNLREKVHQSVLAGEPFFDVPGIEGYHLPKRPILLAGSRYVDDMQQMLRVKFSDALIAVLKRRGASAPALPPASSLGDMQRC